MSGEQDDRSAQVNQEATSERDSFVAGRDLNITITIGNAEKAAEVLAGLVPAAQEAVSIAEAAIPALPAAQSRTGAVEPFTPIPWAPLPNIPVVTWVDAGSRVTSDSEKCHVELHIVPASPSPAPASARPIAPTLLVDVGRQAGLFPSSETVITKVSGDLVSALLTDSVEQTGTVVAGLRAFRNGQCSGWLTLSPGQQRPDDGPLGPMVEEALAMLLAATGSLRRSLPDSVAVAVAVDAGPGAVLSAAPRDRLPARYAVSHPRQVAADLMERLAEPGR